MVMFFIHMFLKLRDFLFNGLASVLKFVRFQIWFKYGHIQVLYEKEIPFILVNYR